MKIHIFINVADYKNFEKLHNRKMITHTSFMRIHMHKQKKKKKGKYNREKGRKKNSVFVMVKIFKISKST